MAFLVLCGLCGLFGGLAAYFRFIKIPDLQDEKNKIEKIYNDKSEDYTNLENVHNRLSKKYNELIVAETSLRMRCDTLMRHINFWIKEADSREMKTINVHPVQIDEIQHDVENLTVSCNLLDCIKNVKQSWGEYSMRNVARALQTHDSDCRWLYPEMQQKFSLAALVERGNKIRVSQRFAYKKAEFAGSGVSPFGYVYVMTNASMPGLIKIGHTDRPCVREVELTIGEDEKFRDSEEYRAAVRASEPPVMKRGKMFLPPPLRDYLETINKSLNTSMPSPFKAEFWMESKNRELDEWFIHEVLAHFRLSRGAGTEFFVLTVDEAEQVFKALFPDGFFQMDTEERRRRRMRKSP